MQRKPPKHCQACGEALVLAPDGPDGPDGPDPGEPGPESARRPRLVCPAPGCGRVAYENPLPVAAAIVEREGCVLLVRSPGWPEKFFGLVTGFVELGETTEAAALREVEEELGLRGVVRDFVGVYDFLPRGEILIAYHIEAEGEVRLGAELEAYKAVPVDKLRPWPFGTGDAVRDWLRRRGRKGA